VKIQNRSPSLSKWSKWAKTPLNKANNHFPTRRVICRRRSCHIICSRYDPQARARAANMTSYVAMVFNILLAIGKVSYKRFGSCCSILLVTLVIPRL